MKPTVLLLLALLMASCAAPGGGTPQDLLVSAEQARLTADAAQEIAESQERYLTATAEAPIIRITETAAGLIVLQTSVAMTKTEIASSFTPTVVPTHTPDATQTLVFKQLSAEQQFIENNVERDRLELEREQKNNEFWRLVPGLSFAVISLMAMMFGFMTVRKNRYKPAPTDSRGNILPVMDVVDGQVTDVDRNPNFQAALGTGLLQRYIEQRLQLAPRVPAVTPERQDAVTERDQMVDMATRGLPSQSDNGRKKLAEQAVAGKLSGGNMQNRFKLLDSETSNLEVIDGEVIKVLDMDWKEGEK